MSAEETTEFLSHGTRTGKLATVRPDGGPHVQPIWFVPDEMLAWATRIAFRYMGPELAASYGRRNAVPGELMVRLTPTHLVTEAGVAD